MQGLPRLQSEFKANLRNFARETLPQNIHLINKEEMMRLTGRELAQQVQSPRFDPAPRPPSPSTTEG